MANFASKEGTLNAGVSQTWDFKTALGVNASSLVYSNDDASSTHQLVIDGSTITVKPGEQRVLSGVQNWNVLVIGGDAGSSGAYRVYASSDLPAPLFYKPYGGPITTTAIADGAVTDAKLAVGAHLPTTTSAAGSPFPVEVMVIDVADAADAGVTGIDYTGLVGKHELLSAVATFTGVPSNTTKIKVLTAGGAASIAEITSPDNTTGRTVSASIMSVANSVLASGATFRVHREQGGGSSAARLTLTFMKVA